MQKSVFLVCTGLVGGFLIAIFYPRTDTVPDAPGDMPRSGSEAVDVSRVAALERTVSEQIGGLRREVDELRDQIDRLSADTAGSASNARAASDFSAGDSVGISADSLEQRLARASTPDGRIDLLTDAGFSIARAQEINRLLEEHRLAAMQERFESARRGDSPALGDESTEALFETDAMLRAELGDADFERYLEAIGRPTAVDVIEVLGRSAAEQAGMQSGDRIVSYDGHRVFDVRELIQIPLEGEPGAPVIVDIVRDGQPMQLVLPRGPLGISAGVGPTQRFDPNSPE